MKDVERCENCRFYNVHDVVCRRYPPLLEGFPEPNYRSWCGEWQAVDAPKPPERVEKR